MAETIESEKGLSFRKRDGPKSGMSVRYKKKPFLE